MSTAANKQLRELKAIRLEQANAAKLLRMNVSTLRDRGHEIPPDGDGKYSLEVILDWLFKKLEDKEKNSAATRKAELEIRRLENQIRNQEADFLLKAGKLVDREFLKSKLDRFADLFRDAGDQVGRKKKLTGKQAQSIYNGAFEKFARELEGI